jgi:polyhydroxyalkanoate synthesis regulator phasin
MGSIKVVDDLVKAKKLTREEREFFEDLIKETKDREERIEQCSRKTRENLKKFSLDVSIILEQTVILSKLLLQVLDELETHYLRSLPADKFYRE